MFGLRIQRIAATHVSNFSVGVLYCKAFLGRCRAVLTSLATASAFVFQK